MNRNEQEDTNASSAKEDTGCYYEDVILSKLNKLIKCVYIYIKNWILNKK